MAYARYDRNCNWYVFWESAEGTEDTANQDEELLAIWHVDHRAVARPFTYTEVREMLDRDDLSRVLGYQREDHGHLKAWMSEWIHDVDK